MSNVQFIKSFSKGQITIPKTIRDQLGMQDDFWLKLTTWEGKIIAEPIEKSGDKTQYKKKLLCIKGNWFDPKEQARNKQQIEKHLTKRGT